jgi:hypothetical protein
VVDEHGNVPGAAVEEPAEALDVLPDELDPSAYVGPYVFPDIRRRRIAGVLHAVVASVGLVSGLLTSNGGLVAAGVLLALASAYHFAAAWPLRVQPIDALATASRAVGFPVGHASAQLAWRGLRSRPTWRILVYSSEEPPAMRGLVELDAVDGSVLGEYSEPNPERWPGAAGSDPDAPDQA